MISFLKQAWLVLLLAVGFGVSLAAVQQGLQPRIDENKRLRLERAVLEVVPGGVTSDREELDGHLVYRVRDGAGVHLGWGIPAESMGFQDKIRVMVGLTADAVTITGIQILESNETPGLGDKIYSEDFRGEFKGKPSAGPLVVVKPGESNPLPIHAITGATISSKAVTRAVNDQLARVRTTVASAGEASAAAAASSAGGEGSDAADVPSGFGGTIEQGLGEAPGSPLEDALESEQEEVQR